MSSCSTPTTGGQPTTTGEPGTDATGVTTSTTTGEPTTDGSTAGSTTGDTGGDLLDGLDVMEQAKTRVVILRADSSSSFADILLIDSALAVIPNKQGPASS